MFISRSIRPPQIQSETNIFLKTSVCADGSQHLQETNRIKLLVPDWNVLSKCKVLSRFPLSSSHSLDMAAFEYFYEDHNLFTKLINNKTVCRTFPATQSQLNSNISPLGWLAIICFTFNTLHCF